MIRKLISIVSELFSIVILLLAKMIPYKEIRMENEIYVREGVLEVVMLMMFISIIAGIISFLTTKNKKYKIFSAITLIVGFICIYQGYMDDLRYVGI